jgi:hypothetical protein
MICLLCKSHPRICDDKDSATLCEHLIQYHPGEWRKAFSWAIQMLKDMEKN